jgi:TatD DNase family protein
VSPKLADGHVHVDLYLDRDGVLDRAAAADVIPVVVSTRPSEFRNLSTVLAGRGDSIRLALGFHPEAAGSVYAASELGILESLFPTTRWIGEIGLDKVIGESVGSYFGNTPTVAEQTRAFERILALGVGDKILSIHSRAAEAQAVDMLAAAGARAVMLHWYRGDQATAQRAIDLGYFLSVNIAMAEDAAFETLLRWLPAESLLLETDGPFTETEGVASEPRHVRNLVGRLALLRGEDPDALTEQLSRNFTRLESGS